MSNRNHISPLNHLGRVSRGRTWLRAILSPESRWADALPIVVVALSCSGTAASAQRVSPPAGHAPLFKQVNAGNTQLNGLQGGHLAGGANMEEADRGAWEVRWEEDRVREMVAFGNGERDSARRLNCRGVCDAAVVAATRDSAMTQSWERRGSAMAASVRWCRGTRRCS